MLGHAKPSLEKKHDKSENLLYPLKKCCSINFSFRTKKHTKKHIHLHIYAILFIYILHEAYNGLGDMIRKSFFYQTDNLSSVPPPHTNSECLTCDS